MKHVLIEIQFYGFLLIFQRLQLLSRMQTSPQALISLIKHPALSLVVLHG